MGTNRTLSSETLSHMVAAIRPDATICKAELAQDGHLSVYHLVVDTPTGTDEWVLKAPPDDHHHGIDTEARLLSVVADYTSIPVPAVLGVVDTHDSLPAPFFLMARAEGEHVPKRAISELSDTSLKRVSFQTGEYLAELHSLDAPDAFGQVAVVPSQSLAGEPPSIDLDQLTVTGFQGSSSTDTTSWLAILRTWAEEALDRHASTRFGDRTDEISSVVRSAIESMDGPFDPRLGRIDHGLHNLLCEPPTGTITGVIDWGFTLAVPPAYDLACVEANLSLDPWSVHPGTPTRRQLVRTNLLEGYRTNGGSGVLKQYHNHRSVYELVAVVRAMNHLDSVTELAMPDATEQQVDEAARAYRDHVTEVLA